jgi:hypothetical protein
MFIIRTLIITVYIYCTTLKNTNIATNKVSCLLYFGTQWKQYTQKCNFQHTFIRHWNLIEHALNAFFSIPCNWIISYHIYLRIEHFNVYTHNTVFQWAVQSTEYSDLCFLHHALWYNYATWTNEMRFSFFNFWRLLHVSNHPENEPTRFETCKRYQKLKNWINPLNPKLNPIC